jgi:hypothetical protein
MRNENFEPRVDEFLRACTLHYDALVERLMDLDKNSAPEGVLAWAEMTAGFAGMHHPGRFFDGALENIALALGRQSSAAQTIKVQTRRSRGRRRILHVATVVPIIAGHTRTILNWIVKDQASEHSLFLTRQGQEPVPSSIFEAITASGGQTVSLLESTSIRERALSLRCFAREAADLVVLHVAPNDLVPVVAFADPGTPPVALLNICDQCFWVGCSVADMVIHLREIGATTSRQLRPTRNDRLLPIPLCETRPALTRRDARLELGIPDSQIVLLTVGRSLKYAPSARQNFFRTAREILNRNPDAHLYLVGVRNTDHIGTRGFVSHERMHFVGPVEDATRYQAAADVYIEGFPFGSQTALLESVLPGVACVPAYAPLTPLLATHDFALTGIVDNPLDEEGYIARAGALIASLEERTRMGDTLRERVLHYHVRESWNDSLEQAYCALGKLVHSPSEIPHTTGNRRSVDLAISAYHATRLRGDPAELPAKVAREGMLSTAWAVRQRGFHRESFRLLRLANRRRMWDMGSILFAAKLVPHSLLYGARARAGVADSLD